MAKNDRPRVDESGDSRLEGQAPSCPQSLRRIGSTFEGKAAPDGTRPSSFGVSRRGLIRVLAESMRRELLVLNVGIAILAVGFVAAWSLVPVSREMIGTPGYFAWTRGSGELTYPIFQAFTRDHRFRDALVGGPVEWVLERFPEANDGSEYSEGSYRNVYRPETTLGGDPIDHVYWLNGSNLSDRSKAIAEEDNFGYCVLVRDGKIVEFRWVKG